MLNSADGMEYAPIFTMGKTSVDIKEKLKMNANMNLDAGIKR